MSSLAPSSSPNSVIVRRSPSPPSSSSPLKPVTSAYFTPPQPVSLPAPLPSPKMPAPFSLLLTPEHVEASRRRDLVIEKAAKKINEHVADQYEKDQRQKWQQIFHPPMITRVAAAQSRERQQSNPAEIYTAVINHFFQNLDGSLGVERIFIPKGSSMLAFTKDLTPHPELRLREQQVTIRDR